ncbi:HlyD family secretion protein [Pseudomonas sp. Choline-3u-10]|jgi:multidrug resistance efflux pump|uniref:HlyD family secretion protein n=1 Tax=Pseudomonadaceae TaxID=135621 RepID=UPI0006180787|nr:MULTISPECIES: HlyD family secretion protein [Pseudomonadaceae]MAL35232.1 HlyD family secretion protein [Pseudomonas sp.]MBU0950458.1 HlyD family secretion protein [Gammaproteobacteria bacterium]KJJ63112.1 hemolysin secretion protein D [Pseudomonas sp. 10B238]MBK3796477.1 HlyD family efflux transporter periplasmic adaptor subunit [Stutzerimonas stutzeri]MBK3876980.1 HlyD family efflux transporter periplasmic adaptor subunit [Stutzerimonas stutzeri]|tara:strand:- start:857 stop:2041 length:1185 start_codon:yes stop_codon:yes gene_type:complete
MSERTQPEEQQTLQPAQPTQPSAAATDAGPTPDDPPKTIKPSRRSVILMVLVALIGVLAILYAWQLWPFIGRVAVTENAYVRGQITVLAPQVSGYVTEVLVQDFEEVEQGQPLVRIDDRQYRQLVEQRRAELAARRFELENLAQTLASNRATLAARRAELAAAEAELKRGLADEKRVNELAERGSVSIRERDQIRATARADSAQVQQARAAIDIAEQTLKASEVSRGGLQAQVEIAESALKRAQIDLDNTVIDAPRDGQVSEVTVRQGQYVTAGSQLLYLVPEQLWVIANYKETQTFAMRPGQPVEIEVDALDGARLRGHVQRLAPATGSEFSVLRPDNATGNFTKVVQRVPVRISIAPDQPLAKRLRPGLSVVTHVDTGATAAAERSTADSTQ